MKILRCSNPACESRKESDHPASLPFFEVCVTVDEYRNVSEPMHKIDVGAFSCLHCGSPAEEYEEEK